MTDTPILEEGNKVLDLEACATSFETRKTSEDLPLNQVPDHLHKFANMFLKEGFNKLPPHQE